MRFPLPLLLGLLMSPQLALAAPEVQITSGPVVGMDVDGGVEAFLGIPYAKPPLGALRWAAPQAPEPWQAPYLATDFGSACVQGAGEMLIGDEDCLYLNVWRPAEPSQSPRPVMFWIHGGANVLGEAGQDGYNGANLAANTDSVVVSINYRLGPLGFFDHPALHSGDAEANSGNFATLDMIHALEWVQANAEALGADADRVTVFGESAGGWNTWSMVLSPLTDGLVHGAVAESGCADFLSVAEARQISADVVEALVVADGLATEDEAAAYVEGQSAAWIRNYLRAKSASEIYGDLAETIGVGGGDYDPIADGYVLPDDVVTTLSRGAYKDIPMIVGSNRDEMKLFMFAAYNMGPVGFQKAMHTSYGGLTRRIVDLYPRSAYPEPQVYNQYTDIADWYLEVVCTTYPAMLAAPHHDLWVYNFRYDGLTPPSDQRFGACHASEIGFVFDTQIEDVYAEGTEAERAQLTAEMQGYWGCLAHTGDPNACGEGQTWPQFEVSGPRAHQRMLFSEASEVAPMTELELDRVDFWVDLYGLDAPWY